MKKISSQNLTSIKRTVDKVLSAAYYTYDSLGPGLLERNYQKGMEFELEFNKIQYERYFRCEAFHRNRSCGPYYVDLFVEKTLGACRI